MPSQIAKGEVRQLRNMRPYDQEYAYWKQNDHSLSILDVKKGTAFAAMPSFIYD
jgi:hypothetical protein